MAEDRKIGVFLCECGGEISNVLDLEELERQVAALPNVSLAETVPYGCDPLGEDRIRRALAGGEFDQLVVAGCSPRIMEPEFRTVCLEAGQPGTNADVVNVRDHCTWVHGDQPDVARGKALDLIRMGLARASARGNAARERTEIIPAVLVVGGGIAGLTSALVLSKHGIPVKLIERQEGLGGLSARRGSSEISKVIDRVRNSPNIQVFTGTEVISVSGPYGNYDIEISEKGEPRRIMVGAAILAMGAEEGKPDGIHGYGAFENTVTQLELEERMARESGLPGVRNVVMIHCGTRGSNGNGQGNPLYESWAVENAIELKKREPNVSVSILHDGLQPGSGPIVRLSEEARKAGVDFVQVASGSSPEVTTDSVTAETGCGSQVVFACDLVVITVPLVPHESSRRLASAFGVPVDTDGFLADALPNLKPDQYTEPCVHIAGSVHWPCSESEAMAQAYGRASRIADLVKRRSVESSPRPASVNVDLCRGCATCRDTCPFDVPVIKECGHRPVAHSSIDPFLCKACGSCVVHCPTGAIEMVNLPDEMFLAEIEAALSGGDWAEVKTLAFVCEWSGYAVWDLIGARRVNLPPEIIPVRVPCAARISPKFILNAFQQGADGVMMCACLKGDCHYLAGNFNAEQVFNDAAGLLSLLGIEDSRFQMEFLSPVEIDPFLDRVTRFVDRVKEIGPTSIGKIPRKKEVEVS